MAPRPVDEARFSHPKGGKARIGAVMILLYPEQNRCMVPFIKRPVYEGVHSGQVAFPGGKWEETDQNLKETALRETEEEIGVKGKEIALIGRLSDLYIPPSNFLVSPYIGYIPYKPVFDPDPKEVSSIIHCDFDTLVDRANRKQKKLQLQSGYAVDAPYFDIHQEIVWGATAMMLGELMEVWEK
ncbi:NUDIX hydrolase [Echinicola jeungdonensis]|uniref:NUDIX hydrolase n=1 Tax=Echinicola jeungdonensis TaxID=709343 RepID=A0ABV5J522_9BACT